MRKGADIRFRVLVCIAVLVCMGIFEQEQFMQETGRIEILCKGTSMHQKEVVLKEQVRIISGRLKIQKMAGN